MKNTIKLLFLGLFLFGITATRAQISTSTGGVANVLPNEPTTNTNVGIGTTTPTEKLDVVGNIKASGTATFASTVTAPIFIKSGGTSSQFLKADGTVDTSVYATTTNLNLKADDSNVVHKTDSEVITGTKTFTSNLSVNSISVGTGTGNVSSNTAIGRDALLNNSTGVNNTAIGRNALILNTTANNNSAFGQNSLASTSTGSSNSAFGVSSLYSNTIGVDNSSFGWNSLRLNVNGDSNSAFGVNALAVNVNGYGNSAFGKEAMRSSVSATNNSAFGTNSLYFNTGSDNSAFGQNSLYSNTGGYSNTGLGINAMRYNTSGSYNVSIGKNAGNTTGDKVTLVTNSNNSIMLGYNTSPLINNQTNQIVIGANAIGNGSNTVTIGDVNITNNYFKGNVHGGAFVKSGGTPSQFLKADGSVDSSIYATTSDLSLKANIASPTFTGTVVGITKAMVGLSDVDNTSDANKPISTATQTALDLKQNTLTNPITGTLTSGYIPEATGSGTLGNSSVYDNGKVGIGTTNPDEKLTVNGTIHATEVKVTQTVPADYVFQKYYTGKSELKSDYIMPTLVEIESFAKKNNHLPNVPSAQEIQEKGLSLGEMSNILLQKVEELTLYAIEQNKELERLKKENEQYKSLAERLSVIEKELKN